jgi:hypothetical protein
MIQGKEGRKAKALFLCLEKGLHWVRERDKRYRSLSSF